jgi:hypothetical protein
MSPPAITYDHVLARARELNAKVDPKKKLARDLAERQLEIARANLTPARLLSELKANCEGERDIFILLVSTESEDRAKEVIRELAEDAKKLPESMTLEFCRPCYVALRICL